MSVNAIESPKNIAGQGQEYFNFINSINSPATRKLYVYCLEQFLGYCKLDLRSLLELPVQQITNIITEYMVTRNASRSFKNQIFATLKHACDMNDVILNWKKIKKFTKSQRTGNEIAGRDRGYTHQELQRILQFSDQRVRTAFYILISTGCRIGALSSMKVGDLEKIDDLYKVVVYAGEKEQYVTWTTPEAAKEIDAYLQFRSRRGENITSDSYLIVKKFRANEKAEPFKGYSLRELLQSAVENSGLRQIDHDNPHKRKEIPVLHGVRKWHTKQLTDSKISVQLITRLLGHDATLMGRYYKPSEKDLYEAYLTAIPFLTISDEERLRFKLEERIRIERTQIEQMRMEMEDFKEQFKAMKEKSKD